MVRVAGLEPAHTGVRVPCLTSLAIPQSNMSITATDLLYAYLGEKASRNLHFNSENNGKIGDSQG